MWGNINLQWARNAQRGISILMVAIGLLVLLGVSALAIDLVTLYVARNEAQRAADAAALAGAKAFVDSGFTSGVVPASVAQNLATARAINVGGQNKVGGQTAFITSSDVSFDFSVPENPRITVAVQRIAARGTPDQPGGAMPTIFAKVLGFLSADVSAMATAEAYNPSGSPVGPTLCTGCLKPVVLPNCDASHTGPIPNPFCGLGVAKFVDPACLTNPSYPGICNPGAVSQGGVIGMEMVIRPAIPSDAPAPSQYYSLDLDCVGNSPQSDIESCNATQFACGDTLCLQTGNQVGPVGKGFRTLIHQPGQDTIDTSGGLPFPMTGGSNNPNPALQGQLITSSDSIVTIPLYDGHPLCPGGSCGFTVRIVGYLQLFVTKVTGGANVHAVILNVAGCGTGGGTCSPGSGTGGPGGTISGGGGSLIPIRLVRNPGT